MLGAMYIGALQELCGQDPARWARWVSRLQHCAGTSVGAILAFLVAAGVHPWRMKVLMDKYDIGGVLADIRQPDLQRILGQGSLSSGEALDDLLQAVVREAAPSGSSQCTLGELASEGKPGLVITVTNASTGTVEFWSANNHASMPVWVALRASASVPGLFPPVVWQGCPFHDGGITCNVPCHLFSPRETLTLMVHMGPAPSGDSSALRAVGLLTPENMVHYVTTAATAALKIVQWYMCAAQVGPMRAAPLLVQGCIPCSPVTSSVLLGRSGAFAFDAASVAADALMRDGANSVVGVLGRSVFLAVLTCVVLFKRPTSSGKKPPCTKAAAAAVDRPACGRVV